MNKTLVSLDSKGKVRVVEISYDWSPTNNGFVIRRITGQLGGKQTQQPDILVEKGKAGRTVTEQTVLQFNSHLKKYLDKGYKEWEDILDEAKIKEALGDIKTGQDGMIKPMLAKQADKVANKFFDRDFYGSRKINGVRCLIYYKDGEVHTSSRGAINYDLAIYHIIEHPTLIKFFENNPTIILDGEIFKMGYTLNKISGLCRHIEKMSDTEPLEFYWYDIYDTANPDLTFETRWELMQNIAKYDLILGDFNPEREWKEGELKIQFLPQIPMTGWSTIKKYHDKYVAEGFEGLVIRKIDAVYGPGKRSNDMIKVKEYMDSEFEIVGLSEGLRDEDMCFIMKTEDGQEFKAKPHGDRAQKQWYREHLDELIGKMATIKYFEMSGKEGSSIPQQPQFVCVRDYE